MANGTKGKRLKLMAIKQCTAIRHGSRGLTGCKDVKNLKEFPVVNANPDGRGSICKECVIKYNKNKRLTEYVIVKERAVRASYEVGRKPMPPMWAKYLRG